MNLKIVAAAVVAGIVLVMLAGVIQSQPTASDPAPSVDTIPVTAPDETVPVTAPDETVPVTAPDETVPVTAPDDADPTDAKSTVTIMETDGVLHTIPLEEIRGGGPPKDGIPSIDNPVFAEVADSAFMSDSDTVIGLEINGQARAYPLFILVWHEIVNDEVGGTPVSVTYCPLCYTNQVFERIIDGQTVEFGTSGKLYNSNLLMYDRLTESYWSQAVGLAVKGPLSGRVLETVPFDVITWGDWKGLHPDTLVLTTDTGHSRAYNVDPYGSYYTDRRVMFPIDNRDDRLHPKEIILGFSMGNTSKAYPQSVVESEALINDAIGDTPVLIASLFPENARAFERTVGGQVLDFEYEDGRITDTGSGSVWNYDGLAVSGTLRGEQLERLSIEPGFWFEWFAFHPQTLIYGDGS